MIDRLFTAALTFVLLAGGTAAVGSALFETRTPAAAEPVVVLPAVQVTAQRVAENTADHQPVRQ